MLLRCVETTLTTTFMVIAFSVSKPMISAARNIF